MGALKNVITEVCCDEDIGEVLEVGVGKGDFMTVLFDCFDPETKFTGIDIVRSYIEESEKRFENNNVNLFEMSAEEMNFSDNSFDIACISNTLHHLPDVSGVLNEMQRVVKNGGYIVIHELIQDNPTVKQNVHITLHHLNSEIDSLNGIHHNYTYKKNEIINLLKTANLTLVGETEYFVQDEQKQGSEKETIDNICKALNLRVDSISDPIKQEYYRNQLELEINRAHVIGFEIATEYIAIAKVGK